MQLFDPNASGELIPALNLDESEVQRQMTICNACRYCEGFCAVFPAMTRRLEFTQADIHYLANLCHNCGACLHACQYAAPHEFEVNVPKAMAKVRLDTYAEYAWPRAMGKLYQRNGLTLALASGAGLALFLCLTLMIMGNLFTAIPGGNFYGIFPHNTLALMFGAVFGFAVLALTLGVRRFWHNISPPAASLPVKNLSGAGGDGQRCSTQIPGRRSWSGLQQRRRYIYLMAPPVSPPHLLRLHAVLRSNRCRHAVSLSAEVVGALPGV